MKGSEKQIMWAEGLKSKAVSALEWMRENPNEQGKANLEMWNKGIDFQLSRINSLEYAGQVIDALRYVSFDAAPEQVAVAVVSQTNRYFAK